MHSCPECGLEHGMAGEAVAEAAPVVEVGPNDQAVEIAKIEAKARIESDRIFAEGQDARVAAELEVLRAENDRLAAEQAPAVVVVDTEPEPEPEPVAEEVIESEPEPPETSSSVSPEPKAPKKKGWWDAYS
jgi:hypothetical protein